MGEFIELHASHFKSRVKVREILTKPTADGANYSANAKLVKIGPELTFRGNDGSDARISCGFACLPHTYNNLPARPYYPRGRFNGDPEQKLHRFRPELSTIKVLTNLGLLTLTAEIPYLQKDYYFLIRAFLKDKADKEISVVSGSTTNAQSFRLNDFPLILTINNLGEIGEITID